MFKKIITNQKTEEGFTLIELMIVVVIIGILAAITIPIFINQQKAATLAALKSDVKNVITMATTYKTKNDGLFPRTCTEWDQAVTPGWTSETTTLFRVKTSTNGHSLWIEAQPATIKGSDPSAVRAENTIVYNSERGSGLTTRGEFEQQYSYPSGTSLSNAEGYTTTGFRLDGETGCKSW